MGETKIEATALPLIGEKLTKGKVSDLTVVESLQELTLGHLLYCFADTASTAVNMRMLRTKFLRIPEPYARSIADAVAAGIADTEQPCSLSLC